MTKMLLTTDVDDVAVNWIGGFAKHATKALGRPILMENYKTWDMKAWLGVDDPLTLVRAFNSSHDFGFLEAFPCALELYPAAAEAGHPIVAITACADDVQSHRLRIANLDRVFGPIFEDVLFVPLGGDKTPHLRAAADRYGLGLWLEDNHKNALAGAEVGHRTYMVRRAHNQVQEQTCRDPRLTWVDDLYPVMDLLGLRAA